MDEANYSIEKMWNEFVELRSNEEDLTNSRYQSWHFCNNEEDANELAQLVIDGTKRGTASLHLLYEIEKTSLPKVGDYNIITNWYGDAQCIIQGINVHVLPFSEITEELAYIEGEGDKTLDYWRRAHLKFFKEEAESIGLVFNEDMLIVFEEFRKVYP